MNRTKLSENWAELYHKLMRTRSKHEKFFNEVAEKLESLHAFRDHKCLSDPGKSKRTSIRFNVNQAFYKCIRDNTSDELHRTEQLYNVVNAELKAKDDKEKQMKKMKKIDENFRPYIKSTSSFDKCVF